MKKNKGLSQNKLASLQLENVVKYAPGFFYCKDKDSVYQWCNDEFAQLAGLENREQVIGKTDFELAWKERAQLYVDVDKQVMETGIPTLSHEEVITISHNRTITAITNKVPIFNKRNKVVGLLGITTDITHQKKIEEELRIAKEKAEAGSRSKTEFIGNMSHDIRTPLTGILGISEFLMDELVNPADKERITDIHNCGKQLLGLLNSILEVSSLDSNENEVVHKSFDLYQLIDDLCELEKPAVLSRHLVLHQLVDKNVPRYLVGDKMKIHRILLNLIGNAIKFTKKGSVSLEIKLLNIDEDKATIEFSVIDTGIGIPKEAQAQVFERFYKVSPSYEGKFIGNGIGLHIVQKYTTLLGGKINFESEAGEGTRFYFSLTLPLGEETTNNDSDYDALLKEEKIFNEVPKKFTTEEREQSEKPKILVIEDNAMALTTLKLLLSRFDVSVIEAMDAEIGFELIKKHQPFDLIITDIGLPGISGDEMVRLVRAYEKENLLKSQKIVALTGHAAYGEFEQQCVDAGINKIYQKPMSSETLRELVEPLLLKCEVQVTQKSQEPTPSSGKLGVDLPDTEEQLFEINKYPIFDVEVGEKILGSKDLVYEILKDFKNSTVDGDLGIIKKSHKAGDWETVGRLSHKIKGGSTYGTVRLYYALLYMERYLKAGHKRCAEDLYVQMLRVIDETSDYLEKNL